MNMMHLACIADGEYVRHTGVMLRSALSKSGEVPACVTLLHSLPISEWDRRNLLQVAEQFGAQLRLMRIESDRIADLPQLTFSRSVWLRIFLPELLPDLDKVLYLDSDLIVTDSLYPLWDLDLAHNLLAAVVNPFYPFMPEHPRALGLAPQEYLNSGVLLMNLSAMRRDGTVSRLRQYARLHPRAAYPDQDAYNDVCRHQWLHLHPRWNVQSSLFDLGPERLPLPREQVVEALANPAVIHYIGPFKPWHFMCRHPRQGLYFDHARETPWGEPQLEGRSLLNAALRRMPLAWIDRWFKIDRFLRRTWRHVRRIATAGTRQNSRVQPSS